MSVSFQSGTFIGNAMNFIFDRQHFPDWSIGISLCHHKALCDILDLAVCTAVPAPEHFNGGAIPSAWGGGAHSVSDSGPLVSI